MTIMVGTTGGKVRFLFLLLTVLLNSIDAERQCPTATKNWPSGDNGERAKLSIQNAAPVSLSVVWVNFEGQDAAQEAIIPIAGLHTTQTYVNHHFRIYAVLGGDKKILLKEHRVANTADEVVILGDCDDMAEVAANIRKETGSEMTSLVHDHNAPCLPENDSTKWSCVNRLSKEEYEERLEKSAGVLYGFNSTLESIDRKVGDTVDHVWSHNIPLIPRVTKGPGYLKMSFTSRLTELLMPWYEQHKKGGPNDRVRPHRVIPGGFTNSHTVPMSLLNMDEHGQMKDAVVAEMQRILEWWTAQPLVPTATFGLRIYHQDSMLINHVDRADTHIASAVIQVDQFGLDEGWPLEVLNPDGSCAEVYLQPGELVLYEGARFRHGRPMRLQGKDFANVFSHFRPVDWHGPHQSPKYDGKLDEHGFLVEDERVGGEEL